MRLTDKSATFILVFIPFLFTHCFAEWGSHGQRVRTAEYSEEYFDTLSARNGEQESDRSTITSRDSTPGQISNPEIEKSVTDSGVSDIGGDSALTGSATAKGNIGNSGAAIYNASIMDYHGLVIPEGVEPIAGIKRFRGTVVPGGDTVHFRIPVYGDISLENLEFSGLVYKEPEITIETTDFENPYSFASGLWTIISSAGGLVTLGFATEPLLGMSDDRTMTGLLLVCGYIVAGVGQYFGVDKVIWHFRWKNQFGHN